MNLFTDSEEFLKTYNYNGVQTELKLNKNSNSLSEGGVDLTGYVWKFDC